jgi:hypothetical protein
MSVEIKRARAGWPSLLAWSLAFAALAFSFVSAMTVGLFVAPFALLLCLAAALLATAWPEAPLGALLGTGAICLLIGFLHLDYVPCPTGELRLAPGEHFRCGGFRPTPWLVAGAGLVSASLGAYALFRRRSDSLWHEL